MLISKTILIATTAGAALLAGSNALSGIRGAAATTTTMTSDAALTLASAQVVGEQTGPAGVIPPGSVSAAIESAVMALSTNPDSGLGEEAHSSPLAMAYAVRVFDPIWSRSGARDLQVWLREAEERGLAIDPSLMERVDRAVDTVNSRNESRRAQADLLLSRVFLQVADHLRNGPFNDSPGLTAQIEAVDPEPLHIQLAFAGEGRFDYSRLDPLHDEYDDLLEARQTYIEYVENGGFTPIPEIEQPLELGDEDAVIETLRQRLSEEGFESAPGGSMMIASASFSQAKSNSDIAEPEDQPVPASYRFDSGVEAALIEFQEHNGLEPDGILGPNTIEALNVTAQEKLDRIDVNLERWRWAPRDFGEDHVRVNIPSFTAQGYEDGRATISMNTIVGMPSRETPIFSDSIEHIVANPRWYVPESILQRDKLDDIRENPDFIANGGYFVLDRQTGERVDYNTVDWHAPGVEDRYRLVQTPGSSNALGPVKIMFPNEYSVYLHGTPSESLFERSIRAFSSGCIRLERPEDMARWVARVGDTTAGVEVLNAAWETGDHVRVDLERPIPVYILYYTVEVEDDGAVVFHRDIYDRDDTLVEALNQWELTLPNDSEI